MEHSTPSRCSTYQVSLEAELCGLLARLNESKDLQSMHLRSLQSSRSTIRLRYHLDTLLHSWWTCIERTRFMLTISFCSGLLTPKEKVRQSSKTSPLDSKDCIRATFSIKTWGSGHPRVPKLSIWSIFANYSGQKMNNCGMSTNGSSMDNSVTLMVRQT